MVVIIDDGFFQLMLILLVVVVLSLAGIAAFNWLCGVIGGPVPDEELDDWLEKQKQDEKAIRHRADDREPFLRPPK